MWIMVAVVSFSPLVEPTRFRREFATQQECLATVGEVKRKHPDAVAGCEKWEMPEEQKRVYRNLQSLGDDNISGEAKIEATKKLDSDTDKHMEELVEAEKEGCKRGIKEYCDKPVFGPLKEKYDALPSQYKNKSPQLNSKEEPAP